MSEFRNYKDVDIKIKETYKNQEQIKHLIM